MRSQSETTKRLLLAVCVATMLSILGGSVPTEAADVATGEAEQSATTPVSGGGEQTAEEAAAVRDSQVIVYYFHGTRRCKTCRTIEAYAEYGVTEKWTVLVVVPYKLTEAGQPVANPALTPTTGAAGNFDRLGNALIGARRKFIDRNYVLSGQLDIEIPTGSFDAATGLSTGYDAYTFAPTVSAGKGWRKAYVYGYAGLGLRTNNFSSDWRLGVEGGGRFFGRLWLIGLLDLRRSFLDGDVQLPRSNVETGLYVNDQEFLAYGGKLLIDITKGFGFQATAYSAAAGNNVPRSTLFGLGLYFKWGASP